MEQEKTRSGGVIRVFVADNSRIHTRLLAEALKRDHDLEVIIADADSDGLIAEVVGSDADVLVISSNLDEQPSRGFAVLHQLRSSCPRIRAVVLLDSSKEEMILDAFRAGAKGIFSRQDSMEMLSRSIRCVHQGQIWADSRQMSLAVEALASAPTIRAQSGDGLNLLTKREMEVVHCLAEGLTNREIAERLGLSQHTIKNYLFRVFDKLGVSSRVELLFMTLSQANAERASLADLAASSMSEDGPKEADFAVCKKAAEEGLPAAQFALAQMYWSRRSDPENMIYAYMWYLIATNQLLRWKNKVHKALPPDLLLQAEQRAAEWLRRKQTLGPESSENPAGRRLTMSLRAQQASSTV